VAEPYCEVTLGYNPTPRRRQRDQLRVRTDLRRDVQEVQALPRRARGVLGWPNTSQVGLCIPVAMQLQKAEVGPTSWAARPFSCAPVYSIRDYPYDASMATGGCVAMTAPPAAIQALPRRRVRQHLVGAGPARRRRDPEGVARDLARNSQGRSELLSQAGALGRSDR
jgi:hypothetical protein